MRNRSRRLSMCIGLLASGGFLLAGPGTGCNSFLGESLFSATNFCFIFDCQNGLLGGTVRPCSGIGSSEQTFEGNLILPIFTDCPLGP